MMNVQKILLNTDSVHSVGHKDHRWLDTLGDFHSFLLYPINQDIGNLSGIEPLIEKLVAQVWITMLACKDGRHDISGWDMGMTHGWTTYDCVTCVHAILGYATLYYVAHGWSICD